MRRSLAFVLPLALYVASAYRDVMYWDIGEMDTVPYILGIAHPPGMPLYTLAGFAFTHLLPIGSVAFRMSLLSALAMAATAWIVATLVTDETGDEPAALAAALLFATGGVAWAHGTRAEVHALAALAFASIALLLLRWCRNGSPRTFYLAAAAFGCGIAIHPVVGFSILGFIAAVMYRASFDVETSVLIRGCALAAALAAAFTAYLPLRSAWIDAHGLDPLAAYGMNGSAFWNYGDPAHPAGLAALLTGSDITVGEDRLGMNGEAFTNGLLRLVTVTFAEFAVFAVLPAVYGGAVLFRRSAARAWVAVLTLVPSAIFGCAFGAESDVDRYFLPFFVLVAMCAGVAIAAVPRGRAALLAAAGACALFLLVSQRQFFMQPRDDRAVLEADAVLRATPPDAVIVATWVLAPPLAYDDYVLHETGGRLIVPAWYGDVEDQLPAWVRARQVFVSGTPQGSVPGFHLERMPAHTELYRVVRDSPSS